ncbi:translation elongation factor Ts [bacterium DOLZORAL124_38_8]|nr:MAG: translation elongation factor Ts [bacterium DOLZORAL124_38_8]
MTVTAAQVKELREKTGVAMMACKKALVEANGDMEAAIEVLKKRGQAKAASKGDRSTGEGGIAISGRAIISVLCETDFVARNEEFVALLDELAQKADAEGIEAMTEYFESIKADKIQKIGENLVLGKAMIIEGGNTVAGYVHTNKKVATVVALNGGTEDQARDVAMHATAMDPLVANPEDIDAELIASERAAAREQLLAEGKPENILDKIIDGKIKKFCAERAMTTQPFVKNGDQTVGEYLGDAELVDFIRMSI